MEFTGQISKMISNIENPVEYSLPIGKNKLILNKYIGELIQINFNNKIRCINCNNKINKTYMQGYCYPCFISSPQTEECVFKPHLCQAHLGKARDIEWAKNNCLVPTYVYLSLTSNLKVGVTRHNNIPSRWIDQGAHYAIKFAKTPNRYLAGLIELEISKYISDRTQWRKMILGQYDEVDLIKKKNDLQEYLPSKLKKYYLKNEDIIELKYPIIKNLEKIKSFNIEKFKSIKESLIGIKGQYLMFNDNHVLNVRKYSGYNFTIKIL